MKMIVRGIPHPGMSFREFVALTAALMALNALAIDSMLPALPVIGRDLGLTAANQQQWVVTSYLLGFGGAQIFYGTLSDRFGRKPVLLAGTAMYIVFSVLAGFASSFETMLAARVLQGVGAAATRVISVSIVRDCYSGRQMARVMSLAFIVFLAVPILAPSVGQLIILFAPWHLIFGVLAAFGAAVFAWVALRLPETLHGEDVMPISASRVLRAFRATLSDRLAVGYMFATAFVIGGLFGYINSAQQIFVDVLHAPNLFTIVFALTAGFMALSSLLNSRLVERVGMRVMSHSALIGYIALSALHLIVVLAGFESLWVFAALQGGVMFCFGLLAGNFGAMAMQPLGHVAGTAASVQGFFTTVGGALVGLYIGQHFNGTTVPMTIGFTMCGLMALACVLFAERGRLFRPHNPPAAQH
ncbi:multidrug effflux MFS transporter [Chelatococcus reniformis]|uniref:Bcr/CflA family efflux transporter n=1 Tax=Chelatococcus reniformis TaxID=1494448 RepID=A0A916TWF9_9HYPH|nr:multidrug effflux MFS transporter [Chelatococcus reniformis]GGC46713.1 Bcr/CflA family drug resistance efflux transporter [Chelatococcus reniformis]